MSCFLVCEMSGNLTVRRLAGGYKLECGLTETSIRLDMQGRWSSFRQEGQFYRRCVDGSLVSGKGTSQLGQEEGLQVFINARHWLISQGLQAEVIENPLLLEILHKAASYRPDDYLELGSLYNKVYSEPVPILPPDRYQDCVVQPAVGCPNRRCTFCAFYKDKPFAVVKKPDFEQHIDGIIGLLGKAEIQARGGLFMGSANAMALSQRRLMECLEIIENKLGCFPRGIAAFADPDFSAPRSRQDWKALASRDIRRIIIGLETGWGELRGKLGKSDNLLKVRTAIKDIKAAGISVGITVLAGVCKPSAVNRHIDETLIFLQSLNLDEKDMIYISLLDENSVTHTAPFYEKRQLTLYLKRHLQAKVVPYQMQRFNYYA